MPSEAVLTIARTIRANLAGSALSPLQAKLYSQRVRRDMGADGLTSFSPAELTARLDEACLLLEAGWLERSADKSRAWTQAVKRAAEVLEWISHAALKPPEAPIHLLSAAAYQVAGYPAMALGHLRTMPVGEAFSKILREFLRGDFDASLSGVQEFWKAQHDLEADHVLRVATAADSDGEEGLVDLEVSTVRHVIMCIGTICSYLRTGETALVDRALAKLDALARSYLHSRDPYSYLLARLSAGAAHRFVDASLWPHIGRLADEANFRTRAALTQFARASFVNRRALVWPAQREGIDRLAANDSFVLCTPTGSGKTTIATLGAVQGLFVPRPDPALPENLVLCAPLASAPLNLKRSCPCSGGGPMRMWRRRRKIALRKPGSAGVVLSPAFTQIPIGVVSCTRPAFRRDQERSFWTASTRSARSCKLAATMLIGRPSNSSNSCAP